MRRKPERIVFGHMHEDHGAELAVAGQSPGGRAIVVASGGDLALALIARGLQVVAVDLEPGQIRLVSGKVDAARAVGAEQAAAWMIGDARDALATFEPGQRAWWDGRRDSLRHGLCFCGRVDRALDRIGPAVRWACGWPELAPSRLQRTARRCGALAMRWITAALHGPASGSRIDRHTIARLESRFDAALRDEDASHNPWLQVLLGDRFGGDPPWVWTATGIAAWLRHLDSLELETGSIEATVAGQEPGSLQLLSISNVFDTSGPEAVASMLDLAVRSLVPGGTFVVRSMLARPLELDHPELVPQPVPRDRSPLCPVVWIACRR